MRGRWSLVFSLLTLAAPAALFAQTEAGLKAGGSFGSISNKGVLPGNLGTRTGFAGGLFVGYHAGPLGFGVEGLYAQRGATSDQSLADSPTRLDFIDVPAYAKVELPLPGVRPFIYAGPQVSFRVRCRTAADAACGTAADSIPKTDYAAVVGAGLRFGGIGLEGRYVYGLRDLKLSTVSSSESYKTRTFLILASIGKF
jgi:Outer membrane protein beta-barrel domain